MKRVGSVNVGDWVVDGLVVGDGLKDLVGFLVGRLRGG